jgi:hypothetical protein
VDKEGDPIKNPKFGDGIWVEATYLDFSRTSDSSEPIDAWKGVKPPETELEPTEYQVGGSHYLESDIQPIDYILANKMPFIEGNVVKYVTRWRHKGGIEDLRKAKHYLEILIEKENESFDSV